MYRQGRDEYSDPPPPAYSPPEDLPPQPYEHSERSQGNEHSETSTAPGPLPINDFEVENAISSDALLAAKREAAEALSRPRNPFSRNTSAPLPEVKRYADLIRQYTIRSGGPGLPEKDWLFQAEKNARESLRRNTPEPTRPLAAQPIAPGSVQVLNGPEESEVNTTSERNIINEVGTMGEEIGMSETESLRRLRENIRSVAASFRHAEQELDLLEADWIRESDDMSEADGMSQVNGMSEAEMTRRLKAKMDLIEASCRHINHDYRKECDLLRPKPYETLREVRRREEKEQKEREAQQKKDEERRKREEWKQRIRTLVDFWPTSGDVCSTTATGKSGSSSSSPESEAR